MNKTVCEKLSSLPYDVCGQATSVTFIDWGCTKVFKLDTLKLFSLVTRVTLNESLLLFVITEADPDLFFNYFTRYVASDERLLCQLYSSSTLQKKIDLPSWEPVIEKQNLKVWRKPKDSTYLYEYKGKNATSMGEGDRGALTALSLTTLGNLFPIPSVFQDIQIWYTLDICHSL